MRVYVCMCVYVCVYVRMCVNMCVILKSNFFYLCSVLKGKNYVISEI